ncbi:hypothetical protein DPEC_G00118660 [Dallia pectoralis]|uniref:Uncharacterized protein n=1 Tax=Dallia pectoralis TaxID=75939 RepID=A0ACC2GPM7_DALPE|nr:hypothetical protein DPEC_G00118660 [Dallia pectoralis]
MMSGDEVPDSHDCVLRTRLPINLNESLNWNCNQRCVDSLRVLQAVCHLPLTQPLNVMAPLSVAEMVILTGPQQSPVDH